MHGRYLLPINLRKLHIKTRRPDISFPAPLSSANFTNGIIWNYAFNVANHHVPSYKQVKVINMIFCFQNASQRRSLVPFSFYIYVIYWCLTLFLSSHVIKKLIILMCRKENGLQKERKKKKSLLLGIISSAKQEAAIWRNDFHTLPSEVAVYHQVWHASFTSFLIRCNFLWRSFLLKI